MDKLKLLLWLVLMFIGLIILNKGNGFNEKSIIDFQIEQACHSFELSDVYSHGEERGTNGDRCTLIGQAQYRFENVSQSYLNKNNIFGFNRHGIMSFDSVEDSIKFYSKRYFKYDYRKTIKQIIMGGCYYNLNDKYVCFNGYTLTKHQQLPYYNYVRNFYLSNREK